MDAEGSGGRNSRLRVSAWFPPGLALAWLAALATFVHGPDMAIAVWGATVAVAFLAVLLIRRRRRARSAGEDEQVAGNADIAPGGTTAAAVPVVRDSAIPELRVLTAEEAASVLRVDAELVKASISSGELPGNRIGPHWRVEQGALTRWLQGTYKN